MSDDESILRADDAAGSSAEVAVALILEGYLADLEAGRPVDPERLIAEHPDLAGPLRACLEVLGSPLGEPRDRGFAGESAKTSNAARPGLDLSTFYWRGDDGLPRVQLSEPASDEVAPVLSRRGLPVQAGRYQILGEIARGGMGAVLRARDADLGRELALKVLLRPHRDDVDLRNRFVEEAQIGGQLQHPGIVPVYELGTFPDRRPFLAMKLVRGRTLAALLAERPEPSHDLPRFLAIFEQICQTVAYAHSRRVIHRDLKPSNVMVGSFGEVQVMDWGLAKVLPEGGVDDERRRPDGMDDVTQVRTSRTEGSGSESRAGSVLGTPAYMAPEQARGEIDRVDERADVFGLGAILCEILTGRPPYVGSSRGEIQAQAARADLADAQARLGACGADEELSRLARDSLVARPPDRPRDAGAVARRVIAYATGVQERLRAAELARVEAQARASEERKRRKLAVGLAAALVGLLVTLGGGGAWWAHDRRERAARLDVAVRGAEVLRGEAQRAGDDLSKWSAAREAAHPISLLLAEARDPGTRARAASLVDSVDRESAEATADRALLDELAAIRVDTLEETADQSDARYSEAFRARGIDPDILSTAEAGRAIAERPPRVALALAASMDAWGIVRRRSGDRSGAERLGSVARRADSDPWRNRLRDVVTEPEPSKRRDALRRLARDRADDLPAVSATLLAEFFLDSDEVAEAEAVLRSARDREPGDVWLNLDLARSLDRLGRPEEAIRYFTAAQAVMPEAAHELAHALVDRGELDPAIAVFRDLARRRPDVLRHLGCLAHAFKSRGRAGEAEAALDSALAACQRQIRLKPDWAPAHHALGNALLTRGDVDGAIAEFRQVLRIDPRHAGMHTNLGLALNVKRDYDAAISEFRQAIQLNPNHPETHSTLGKILLARRDFDAAIAEFREVIRLRPGQADVHNTLGAALRDKGDLDAAIVEFQEAIRLQADFDLAHNNLGLALKARGDLDGAVAEYRQAIRINPQFADPHNNLGTVLYHQGDVDGAVAEFRQTILLNPRFARALVNIGNALHAKGDLVGAIDAWHQARDRGANDPALIRNVNDMLAATERAKRVSDRLPAVLRGDDRPGDPDECLGFAALCVARKLDAAARFYADALASHPALADDRQAQHRYNAACVAALAGCGKGEDSPAPDEAARVKLRQQALDWLKSELAAWTGVLDRDSRAGAQVAQTLWHWKADPDLAGVRDPEALALLPMAEYSSWQALWDEVDRLLGRAAPR